MTQSTVSSSQARSPLAAGLVPVRSRRSPWLLGLGLTLTALGVLTVIWLVGAAGQRLEVLVVSREVSYGSVIARSDVGVARVSVDPGVRVMPASEIDSVVGLSATTALIPGMLLTRGMAEPAGDPRPGYVLVPLGVRSERMPAGGLRPGDRVLVVDAEAGPDAPATRAVVVRVAPPDVNRVTVVDVTTAPGEGPSAARASARGDVALVVEPSGR